MYDGVPMMAPTRVFSPSASGSLTRATPKSASLTWPFASTITLSGVIHRDNKPANVMVDAKGHVKLADFGVARVNDPDAEGEKTRVGAIIGTPSYMSPEQTQGQPIDHRTDIFSAGVLFYQLLTGQKPFDGTGWALAKKIIQDDPVWPSTLFDVSADFDRVVARALAKAPEQRYQTARKFAEDLKRLAAGKEPEAPAIAPPKAAAPAPAS